MNQRTRGLANAMISSSTFGMIPLFSLPALSAGMGTMSVIVYRFLFAAIAMFALIMRQQRGKCTCLRITWGIFWRISLLAVLNLSTAITLIYGYRFMPSGAATTIQFSYPIFTCLIMMLFFGERPNVRVVTAIMLAVIGVAALSGIDLTGSESFSLTGMAFELTAGLSYAVYLVLVPVLKVREMESSQLTLWVFLLSTVYMALFTAFTCGIDPMPNTQVGLNLVLLGFIPTAISNFTLILALKDIGSTLTSILGALEPLTAMVVGIGLFHEPFTAMIGVGFVCIVISVIMLITNKQTVCSQQTQSGH